jgi:two-component system sensor histidine kinase DesK
MKSRIEAPPEKQKVSLWPLLFTLFIGFIFLNPLQRHAGRIEWALTSVGVVIFLVLYTVALTAWKKRPVALGAIAGVALLGFVFAPFNDGAAIFIIYATAFVPYAVGGQAGLSAAVIGLILVVVGAESWLLHLRWVFAAYSVAYGVILGAGNVWAARKSLAVEGLAKIAERERIARDLHDVLGHTLSVVILKAELAGRLLDRDLDRAKTEIGDVEKIAREALAEVRQTIRGYRAEGLQAEIERAKSTLETAGVAVECHGTTVGLTPAQESVLTLVLREAVTNMVRHAKAKTCRIGLRQVNGTWLMEIQDDGRGGLHTEGYGMRGMRERIEAIGGRLMQDASSGTNLTIALPLATNADGPER